jgi:pimeloyl-ACP methyl ester carboxylesterase
MPGFETNGSEPLITNSKAGKGPYDVNQQISFSEQGLKDFVSEVRANGAKDVRVILMGHSLGTYMCMEMLRRLREEAKTGEDVRCVGGVLLFATIMHLTKSPNGKKNEVGGLLSVKFWHITYTMQWLLALPNFAYLASFLVKGLTLFIPVSVLAALIQRLASVPADGARVSAEYIKSPHGLRQTLFMGHDEMKELSIDKWDDEIWGAAYESGHPHPRPVLRFLFGENDHW